MAVTWKPVSKPGWIVGGLAAALFMLYAGLKDGAFLLLDYVNLPVHEAGHLLFSVFGPTPAVWGGTLLQLIMPAAFGLYFRRLGDAPGALFGAFWLGESLLYSSTYIGDARAMALPLVGGGGHDWNIILSDLGLLAADRMISDIVRFVGWLFLALSFLWFVDRGRKSPARADGGH
jgi:hypothetical protein